MFKKEGKVKVIRITRGALEGAAPEGGCSIGGDAIELLGNIGPSAALKMEADNSSARCKIIFRG